MIGALEFISSDPCLLYAHYQSQTKHAALFSLHYISVYARALVWHILELKMAVKHHVGAGKQTQVLRNSSWYSSPRSRLSSPKFYFLQKYQKHLQDMLLSGKRANPSVTSIALFIISNLRDLRLLCVRARP